MGRLLSRYHLRTKYLPSRARSEEGSTHVETSSLSSVDTPRKNFQEVLNIRRMSIGTLEGASQNPHSNQNDPIHPNIRYMRFHVAISAWDYSVIITKITTVLIRHFKLFANYCPLKKM